MDICRRLLSRPRMLLIGILFISVLLLSLRKMDEKICSGEQWNPFPSPPISDWRRSPSSHYIDQYPPQPHVTADKESGSSNGRKLILLWTGYYRVSNWLTNEVFRNCPVSTCETTIKKSRLEESDVLLFHPRNMINSPMPEKRWPHQRWALFTLEPPYLNGINMVEYGDVFNWTVTYRRDSDFVHSYGNFFPRTEKYNNDKGSFEDVFSMNKARSKLVVARISNCDSKSERVKYVRELQKYLPNLVDFYGRCGDIACNRDSQCNDYMKEYKFFLAFENSLCRDYISEKFWNCLSSWHSVPIVMGGSDPGDYGHVAPDMSYINVAHFTSPKALADYLTLLDKNEYKYMQYHLWRKDFYVPSKVSDAQWWETMPDNPAWCAMCAALHNTSVLPQTYRDLSGWYLRDTCPYNDQRYFCPTATNCCVKNLTTGVSRWM